MHILIIPKLYAKAPIYFSNVIKVNITSPEFIITLAFSLFYTDQALNEDQLNFKSHLNPGCSQNASESQPSFAMG